MRTSRYYRPAIVDRLEDRTVPSTVLNLAINTVPVQDARAVRQEFNSFEQTYKQDVQTILFDQNAASLDAARQAFNAAIQTALQGLTSTITTTVQNLPTSAALAAQIQAELLTATTAPASGQPTLQGHLHEIPTPATTSFGNEVRFIRTSLRDIEAVAGTVIDSVLHAPAPTGGIDAATVQADLKAVNTAFQTFRQSYNNDITTTLLPAGTTNPSTNRAAFDTAVANDLATLNGNIATALSNLPTSVSTALATTIKNDLVNATAASSNLQSRLASVRTPSGTSGFSTLIFRLVSGVDIGLSQARVTADILKAVRGFNTPTTTTTK